MPITETVPMSALIDEIDPAVASLISRYVDEGWDYYDVLSAIVASSVRRLRQ